MKCWVDGWDGQQGLSACSCVTAPFSGYDQSGSSANAAPSRQPVALSVRSGDLWCGDAGGSAFNARSWWVACVGWALFGHGRLGSVADLFFGLRLWTNLNTGLPERVAACGRMRIAVSLLYFERLGGVGAFAFLLPCIVEPCLRTRDIFYSLG